MIKKYDAIIIGSGIGGLTCGCYLAKSGAKVLIVEQQKKVGGYCSSFSRQGYKFDVGVHYLGGIKRGILGKILEEIDLKDEILFNQFNPSDKIVMPENTTYVHSELKETIESFKNSFPSERKNIDSFFKFIGQDNFLNVYRKVRKFTFQKVLNDFFTDIKIKATLGMLLENVGLPASRISAKTAILLFREFIMDPGYYPEGGMQIFSDQFAEKFKEYGGEIILSQKVEKILIHNNSVEGIMFGRENIVLSDIVISNIDATQTFKKLLNISNVKELLVIKRMDTSLPVFALYLGLSTNLNNLMDTSCNIWYSISYDLEDQFCNLRSNVVDGNISSLMISFPSLHNKVSNTNTLASFTLVPYESKSFWDKLREPLSELLIKKINMFVPLVEKHISLKITATPITFERFTANKKGASYGWAPTLEQSNTPLLPQQTSVAGLFLVGHWCATGLGEGGISGVASLGRNAARLILTDARKKWGYPTFLL